MSSPHSLTHRNNLQAYSKLSVRNVGWTKR